MTAGAEGSAPRSPAELATTEPPDIDTSTPRPLTDALCRWGRGEGGSTEELWTHVYPELERMANARLARERRGHSLEPRALVHEAFLRLLEQRGITWRGRRQFYHLASAMMQRILLNHARDRARSKRGGGVRPLTWTDSLAGLVTPTPLGELADALGELARVHPRWATVVHMRYFGGFRSREIARALDVSVPTVQRRWSLARAWLYRHLRATEPLERSPAPPNPQESDADRGRDPRRDALRASLSPADG